MKRVITTAVTIAALFLCAHRPARAMVEFCPATLHYQRVGAKTESDTPGALYGFELSALGPRTITSSTLAFDTSAGWYTVEVPGVTLAEKDRHYSAPWVSFVRRDYVSPVFYVQFPHALKIARGWVYTAATQGDSLFGWDKQGTVQCDPSPQEPHTISIKDTKLITGPPDHNNLYTIEAKDVDALSASPATTALIETAQSSKPLESTSCAEPFHDAMVKSQAQPYYPDNMREVPTGEAMTSVEIEIEADGSLGDAWLWGPSGYKPFDDESLKAARDSTYEPARAYCRAVPSAYFFRVTFDPNG